MEKVILVIHQETQAQLILVLAVADVGIVVAVHQLVVLVYV
jgi:hypothetical protein